MVTITTKKILDFAELVQWAWYKNKTDVTFYSDNGSYVYFNEYGYISKVENIQKKDLFRVESVSQAFREINPDGSITYMWSEKEKME